MKRFVLAEYGRLPRAELGSRLLSRLHAFDERHARLTDTYVFDWDHASDIRAKNYVGVVQVPGLTVEILPKIDASATETYGALGERDPRKVLAQHNLLYMLSYAKQIPSLPRDLASLQLQRMRLLDALVAVFINRLLAELKRRLDHCYVHHEENLSYLKGKLLVSHHVRRNAAHREHMFVGFDEFVPDTWLNRILKAACQELAKIVDDATVQQLLREALLTFSEVQDCHILPHHFKDVHLNRGNERFAELLEFARLVLTGSAPVPGVGQTRTFSLLFPMERLFEEFIARFIRRKCEHFHLVSENVHAQAAQRRKWLLRGEDGKGRFQLKPDILIDAPGGETRLIVDTKWKQLTDDVEDAKRGVSMADLYQLYAYAHRYGSPDNVLLYPTTRGATRRSYRIDGAANRRIRIEFVDMNRDLRLHQDELIAELRQVLWIDAPVK